MDGLCEEEVVIGSGWCGLAGQWVFEVLKVLGFHCWHEVNAGDDKNKSQDDESDKAAEILTAAVFLGTVLAVLGSGFELSFVLSLVDVGACVFGSHVFKLKRLYKFYIQSKIGSKSRW